MAFTVTNLIANGTGVGATSFTTASVSPAPNNLIILSTHARVAGGTPNQPTPTGNGFTWALLGTGTYAAGANVKRLTVWRSMNIAPLVGTILIDYAGQTISHATWVVDQVSGTDTTGANGAGAVIQAVTNTDSTGVNTAFAVTLAAFTNTTNLTYGALSDENNTGITKGANFTLSGQGASAGGNTLTQFELKNDTNVNVTDSPATSFAGVAIEISPPRNKPGNGNRYGSTGNGMSRTESFT